tara:strand:- start:520 stop:1008 length:489 start_codon:yes stop_codon:yes gene_type:complete
MVGPNITRRDQRRRKKSPHIDVDPIQSVSPVPELHGTSYKDKKPPIPQEPGKEPHVLLDGEILWTSQYGLTPEGKAFQEKKGGWSLANKTGRTLARKQGDILAGKAKRRGLKRVREYDEAVAKKKKARSERMKGIDTQRSRRKSGGLVTKTYANKSRKPKRA